MIYALMKRIIGKAKKNGTLNEEKEKIMEKLDAFLAGDRLTTEQYEELNALLKA